MSSRSKEMALKKFLSFKVFEWAVAAASLLLLTTVYAMSAEIPHFDTYVNDYAHVLSDNYRHQLNERLHNFELTSPGHAQVVVAIVPSIGDESIEEFANKAFHNNRLGHADNNNGVLTVISMDHKMRIETGYDLEPVLTDSKVHDIMDSMKPALKAGNFPAAFDTEMSTLLPLVSSGSAENAPASKPSATSQASSSKGFPLMGTLILLIIAAGVLFALYRRSTRNSIGSNDRSTTPPPDTSTRETFVRPSVSPDYTRSQSRSTYAPPRPAYVPPRPTTYRSGPFVPTEPYVPPTPSQPRNDTGSTWKSAAAGGLAGFAASEILNSSRRDDDTPSYSPPSDSYSSSSSDSSSSWSSSSDSGFSGGGGDSGGGGGSDSW